VHHAGVAELNSSAYQQHSLQLLPALCVIGQVVKAARVNDLVRHVNLLLLDDVAHQALHAVSKHQLLLGLLLPLAAAATTIWHVCRRCRCPCLRCVGAPRLVVVRWEAVGLLCWVRHGLQVQHTHLQGVRDR